ncbi:MAG: 50S ribosomal protein L33 [Candidatus Daviesbacteria bacterium]|nr:50S ribosomal protein L33 [Candidatus Daviesbacteria bacterium]
MAKKGNRQSFNLECSVCKSKNYVTEKNVTKTKEKLAFKKFCKKCRKATDHNETKLK